jgi:hypothetical protein
MSEAGRNKFIDVAKVLDFQLKPEVYSYSERDVSLYALSVGAAKDALDPQELQFVYELNGAGFRVLPTFAVTFPFVVMWKILEVPGLKFNPMMLLHGEQYLELKRPLPTSGTFTQHPKISQIYDKGKGALIIIDISSVDEKGEEVAFNQSSVFIRGIGALPISSRMAMNPLQLALRRSLSGRPASASSSLARVRGVSSPNSGSAWIARRSAISSSLPASAAAARSESSARPMSTA